MPHLLFFGPPGSGKTSAALALVKELFGEMPPWKIVMLDEADMMTPDAQAALRRIMEAFARNTRFIIICNYVHKIIDPLFSRCSPHRFEPVSRDAQMERLQMICKAENLSVEENVLERLMSLTSGDLRRAVNLLQSAAGIHQTITENAILEVAVVSRKDPWCAEASDGAQQACKFRAVKVMVAAVVKAPNLSDLQKATILHELGAKEFAVLQGAHSLLQLLAVCLKIQEVLLQA
ncbi:hypothetical protein Emag_004175 [Eimeria magna]